MKILKKIIRVISGLLTDIEVRFLTVGITDNFYIDILAIDKGLNYQGSFLYISCRREYGGNYTWDIDILYTRYWYYYWKDR